MWSLILPSLVAGALAGASGGLLGVAALRLRLSALGYAMAHAAFAGAALGLWLGLPPLLTAFLFASAAAFLLGPLSEKTGLPADAVLAILFPLTMALGFLFLALTPGLPLTSPALTLFWGSLLGVGWADVSFLAGIFGVSAGFLLLFRREVWASLVERRLAEEAGIPARWILWTLLFLLGAGVAGSMRLVGGLLVYVVLFLPASSAAQLTLDLRRQFLLAPLLGTFSALVGVGLSFWADLPVGTAIALTACAVFLFCWAISPRRRVQGLAKPPAPFP
ncbi:metal ABC transporter permease [Candidatus Bipolaricaulota bacterium]|nr:metal ABC transporter permease [Candidatus Bipolaricaulota bacterium]